MNQSILHLRVIKKRLQQEIGQCDRYIELLDMSTVFVDWYSEQKELRTALWAELRRVNRMLKELLEIELRDIHINYARGKNTHYEEIVAMQEEVKAINGIL